MKFTLLAAAAVLALQPSVQAQDMPATASAQAAPAPIAAAADGSVATVVVQGKSTANTADTGYRAKRSDTALGLSLSPKETPQALTVLTRQQIEDFGLTGVNELLAATPGVTVEKVETDRTYYTARGFDITNFQLDGVGLPFTNGAQWGDVDTAMFERVEVLRGANGLMSGTGNPSATVNFVRKRPTTDFQASVGLGASSWNGKRLDADVSGGLTADGAVRGRAVLAQDTGDSYLDRYHREKSLVYLALDADLAPQTQLSLAYTEQHSDARGVMWGALPLTYSDGTPTHYDVSTSTAADWTWWNNSDRRSVVELTQGLGEDWQARASLSHRELASDSELFYVYGSPDRTTGLGLYSYPSAFVGRYQQDLADLRVQGGVSAWGQRHTVMAGVSAARELATERSDYGNDVGTALPDFSTWTGAYPKPAFTASHSGSDFNTRRTSAYAAARLALGPDAHLLLGANATQVHSRGENYGVAHRYDAHALTPYLGATYALAPAHTVYASATRIFNPQTEIDSQKQVLSPMRGRNLELGLKSDWADGTWQSTVAVFHTRQNNAAQAAGTFGAAEGYATYYAGSDAIAQGLELGLVGRLWPGLDVQGGYSVLTLKNPAGEDVRRYVPRQQLRLSTSWQVPQLPGLQLGASLRWQDEIRGAVVQPAYTVVDLMAGYQLSRQLKLGLQLRNVGDTRYLNSLYWTQAYYGAPRSAEASLRWTY